MNKLQKVKAKLEEMKAKYNFERENEDNPNHSDGFGMFYSGFFACLKEISFFLNTPEVKEEEDSTDRKTSWRPSSKQIESLRDMLKYNIGVFDYQKFMEVNSLYDDLTKICDYETDRQK